MAQDLARLAAESFGTRGTLGQRQAPSRKKDEGQGILGIASMVGGLYGQLAQLVAGGLSKTKPQQEVGEGIDFDFDEGGDLLTTENFFKDSQPDMNLRRRSAFRLQSDNMIDRLLAGE